jgi:RNA polymerase sigma factor (sigma-70 family)
MTFARPMRRGPRTTDATDAEILARIHGGEIGALGALYDRYDGDARRVVARLGVPSSDVDDVVQLTFLDVLGAAARYDGRESARSWLLGLAVMQVRRRRRSFARVLAKAVAWGREPSPSPPTPEESSATSQRAERVRRALEALSPKKREVLVLVTIEGLSGEEVARLLEIPVATVWTRLHHARRELSARVFEEES